ncbi:Casein kinase I isoform delta-like protein [Hordeum vulgare]|nr:Casein kinase I isoform delta-like protein [Hordeum vulgare]
MRHLPPKSSTTTPNKRRPKPWCPQYSQELKEHLAAEKQIAVARADEVAMAAIRVDPNILEEHLTVKATVDPSRTKAVTWLATLNDNLWCFIESAIGAVDEDYEVFSNCARAYLNSRASRETMGSTEVYNRGPAVRGFDQLFIPLCIWLNELSMNISQVKKVRKIVRIKELATKNNKIFAFPKQFTDDYLSNHMYGEEARKVFLQHPLYNIEVFLKRMKDGHSIIHMHWPKVAKTFNIYEG